MNHYRYSHAYNAIYCLTAYLRSCPKETDEDITAAMVAIHKHLVWYETQSDPGGPLNDTDPPMTHLVVSWLKKLREEIDAAEREPRSDQYIYNYIVVPAFIELNNDMKAIKQKEEENAKAASSE